MPVENPVPFVEGHFTWPSEDPRLLGSQCRQCETAVFPRSFTCPNPECSSRKVEDVEFDRVGTLASFTVVRYPPPPPFVASDPFTPFAIAEVEFANGVQVVGPVPAEDGFDFELGQQMETIVGRYYIDEEGQEIVGWMFKPAGADSHA